MSNSTDVTVLLRAWKGGDRTALDRLVPLIYSELRRIAAHHLRKEPAARTLQPTALVHEAYLRLAADDGPDFKSRVHFLSVSCRVIRRILVENARARRAATLADEGVAETGRVMRLLPDQDTPRLFHVRAWLTLAEALPAGEPACRAYSNGRAVWEVFGPVKAGAFPLDRDRVALDAQLCGQR